LGAGAGLHRVVLPREHLYQDPHAERDDHGIRDDRQDVRAFGLSRPCSEPLSTARIACHVSDAAKTPTMNAPASFSTEPAKPSATAMKYASVAGFTIVIAKKRT